MPDVVPPKDAHYLTKGVILTGGKDTIFTVPSNFWWDLQLLRVSVGTGLAATAKVFVTLGGVEYILNDAGAVAFGIPYDEEGPLHMEAGDILKITGGANNHAFYTVSIGSRQPVADSVHGPNPPGTFQFGPSWGGRR